MGTLTKSADDKDKLITYIFDIFTKYDKRQEMTKAQLKEVAEIFMDMGTGGLDQDLQRRDKLTKPEFIQLCNRVGLKLHHFAKTSTLFEIEFGVGELSKERELEVIRIALDGELDLKEHFQSKLARASQSDIFYILNKTFWQKWSAYVGLPRKDTFQLER